MKNVLQLLFRAASAGRRPFSRLALKALAVGALLLVAVGAGRLSAQGGVQADSDQLVRSPPLPGPLAVDKTVRRFFFPPEAPPLGMELFREQPGPGSLKSAPPELASYVGEIFYPPLGLRLTRDTLTAGLRARVRSYRHDRDALRDELQTELTRVKEQAPTARRASLEALAFRQQARLEALETEAEGLRRALTESDGGWDDLRQWFLHEPQKKGFTPDEVAAVMRGAAFYADDLLPTQRGLLREIAIEIQASGTSAGVGEQTGKNPAFVFLLPELAQVRVPSPLPAAVAESFSAYQNTQMELKKELFDTIVEWDRSGFNLQHDRKLRELAARQAPKIVALEEQAETFRRLLPPQPRPTWARSKLPSALFERVASWLDGVYAMRAEAAEKVFPLYRRYPQVPVEVVMEDEKFRVDVGSPGGSARGSGMPSKREVRAMQNDADAIEASHAARWAVLVQEKNAICAEIGQAIDSKAEVEITVAFDEAKRLAERRSAAMAYDDYQTAVFEPGLSPAQRRLLFSAAVEQLALPLPEGELQPLERH